MMTLCKPTLVTLVASFDQFLLICHFIWDLCAISDKRELLADNSSPTSNDGSLLNGETLVAWLHDDSWIILLAKQRLLWLMWRLMAIWTRNFSLSCLSCLVCWSSDHICCSYWLYFLSISTCKTLNLSSMVVG